MSANRNISLFSSENYQRQVRQYATKKGDSKNAVLANFCFYFLLLFLYHYHFFNYYYCALQENVLSEDTVI